MRSRKKSWLQNMSPRVVNNHATPLIGTNGQRMYLYSSYLPVFHCAFPAQGLFSSTPLHVHYLLFPRAGTLENLSNLVSTVD